MEIRKISKSHEIRQIEVRSILSLKVNIISRFPRQIEVISALHNDNINKLTTFHWYNIFWFQFLFSKITKKSSNWSKFYIPFAIFCRFWHLAVYPNLVGRSSIFTDDVVLWGRCTLNVSIAVFHSNHNNEVVARATKSDIQISHRVQVQA